MQFIFFNAAGTPLFVRSDAESATWTVEDMALVAAFPYRGTHEIESGMRVGFEDELGVLQPFEIRKVENMEPDHYQRITAEHIVISELTDAHMEAQELTNVTAQAALTGILTGTGWSVGTVTSSGTSSGDLALGSVWQNVRTIEANWNVYITPRVTFNTSGITGRYLDIAPAQGIWRGVRLSLDKNADEMGVVIDDTDIKTALFGYGAATDGVPLTFASAVWTATDDHPAKPSGQKYLEDPAATAAYGRNGAARFGFYQNADITDANTLLQKTWEALKATNAPRVTVNCMVRDLYRLGYADQPLRLHDTAMVEIRPIGTKLQLEIIKLNVDLLDPTATRPTIGAYIPNIVYIQRQTAMSATGGAANTVSGRRGGGGSGKTALENTISEFETEIRQNQYQISLRAYQRDMSNVENILRQAGMSIDASGVLVYADDNVNMVGSKFNVQANAISAEVTNRENADTALSGRIDVNANAITLKVSQGDVATQLAVEMGNVTISGGNLVVDGYVKAEGLEAAIANIGTVRVSNLQASGNVTASGGVTATGLYISSGQGAATSVGNAIASIGTASESGGQISIPTTRLDGSQGTPINFNIAATQKYITDVAAAWTNAVGTVRAAYSGSATGTTTSTETITLPPGGSLTVSAQAKRTSAATAYTNAGTVVVNAPAYNAVTVTPVDSPRYFKSDSIAPIGTAHVPVKVTGTTRGDARYFKSDSIAPIGTAHVPVKRTGNLRGDARYFKSDSIAPIGTAHVPVKRTGNLRGSSVSVTPIGTKHTPTLVWGNNIGTPHTPSRKRGTNIGTSRSGSWKYVYDSKGNYDGYYICFSVGKTTMYEAGSSYDYYDVGTSNTLYAAGAGYSYYAVDTNADLYEAGSAATYYNGGSAFEYYDVGAASTLYEAGATLTRYELLNSSEGATNTYYDGGSAFEYYDVGDNYTLYEADTTVTRYELLNSSTGATNTYYTAGTAKTYYEEAQPEPDPEQ